MEVDGFAGRRGGGRAAAAEAPCDNERAKREGGGGGRGARAAGAAETGDVELGQPFTERCVYGAYPRRWRILLGKWPQWSGDLVLPKQGVPLPVAA